MNKSVKVLAVLAGLAVLGYLFAGSGGQGPTGEQVLSRGTASEPPSLDPYLALGNSAATIIEDMFTGLMANDAKGVVVYGLAESHTVSEDGLTYCFTLRPGLKWSNGDPLTADDFVFSFRRLMDPQTGARYAGNLLMIKNGRAVNKGDMPLDQLGVAAPDARTVVFTLERRAPYFLRILSSIATVPVPRKVIEAAGKEWTRPGTIVTTGAFVLTEWVPNTKITLTRNKEFYDAANVKLDKVVYYPTDDTGALVKRYRAGELDIILNFPPEQAEFLSQTFPGEVRVSTNYGLYYYLFNTKKPPFDNPKVRKALSIAVDKDAIAKQILKGDAEAAWSLVPSDISDYKRLPPADAARPLPERLAEAKALLAEAGFTAEKPLSLKARYDSKEESRQIAVALGTMWEAVGVKTELAGSEFRGITADARSGNFDVIRYQWFAPYDDPSTFLALLRTGSNTNLTGYSNPAFDAKIAAADEEKDPAVRMVKLAAAEKDAMADYPVLPLYFTTARRLVSKRVIGWSDFPGGNVQSRYLAVDRGK